jgi:nucleoside-diphosphate-sugar epimerase
VRSHVVTDLALSGLRNREIRLRTTGRERRRLLYKLDCAEALVQMFDAGHKEGDIAGSEWISVVHVAEEISTLLGVGVTPGRDEGHEVMVDPVNSLPGWRPRTSLREGLQLVIGEARTFLAEEGAGR